MFNYVPLTFSIRLDEAHCMDDLQAFAQLFISVDRDIAPDQVPQLETRVDRFGAEHLEYFDYGVSYYQRASYLLKPNRFYNPVPANVIKRPVFFAGKNMWILKPSNLSRGRGIEMFSSLNELSNLLKAFTREGYNAQDYSQLNYDDSEEQSPFINHDTRSQDRDRGNDNQVQGKKPRLRVSTQRKTYTSFVIQKYIERPLLYKGYKFDIRVYAVLTQTYDLYVFRYSSPHQGGLRQALESQVHTR